MSNEHCKTIFLFFFIISLIENYFQQVYVTVLRIYFLPDTGENFIIFTNGILLFCTPAVCLYHCWIPVYKVGVLLTALLSLQAYFFFRLYKAHQSYSFCLPFQYTIWNINSFSSSEKNAIVEDLQAVNVEIKVTKKSDDRVYKTCFFCSHFLKGHYREMVLFPKSVQAKKRF